MIGYWINKQYFQPPEDNPDDIALYKVHVANGTVPKKGIPYTKQSRVREAYLFPGEATAARGVSEYIKAFEQLNNLKEIPQ